jgi:Putative MetA-pathway of phenol degradation
VRNSLDGQRLDTYRGRQSIQATASGTASGPGDLILRGKYNAVRSAASGVAVGIEARLPTGDEENLLGTGQASVTPRAMASIENARVGVHGNLGYVFGGLSEALDYSGAVTVAASPRLTLVGELSGRRLASSGRLIDTVAPHPTLVGIDTVRLTTTNESTARLFAAAGIKWNFRSTWLLSANVFHPLTEAGLTTKWTPTVTLDHSFGR